MPSTNSLPCCAATATSAHVVPSLRDVGCGRWRSVVRGRKESHGVYSMAWKEAEL